MAILLHYQSEHTGRWICSNGRQCGRRVNLNPQNTQQIQVKEQKLWIKKSDFLDSIFQELELNSADAADGDRPRWCRSGKAFVIADIDAFEKHQLQPRFGFVELQEFQVQVLVNVIQAAP